MRMLAKVVQMEFFSAEGKKTQKETVRQKKNSLRDNPDV